MKKIVSILLSLSLVCCSASVSFADSVIDTIMTAGTTQAFTAAPVSEDDLTTILQAGLAAASLGYGVKIVSSPTMTLNGTDHDALCAQLGVDPSMQAVAVLLIGCPDTGTDTTSSATTRSEFSEKVSMIK